MRQFLALLALGATATLTQAQPASIGLTMAKLTGTCVKLATPEGDRTAGCNNWVLNMAYSTGRSQFVVMVGEDESVSFGGVDSAAQGDVAELAVDYVLTGRGDLTRQTRHEVSGKCTYTNPYAGPSHVDCLASGSGETFELHFVSDGSPPDISRM